MRQPYVIYHANCADGFGAAYAAWVALGDRTHYIPVNYVQQWSDVTEFNLEELTDNDVYILDFSFPDEIFKGILAKASNVVWLDHHKSAFDNWCGGIPEGGIFHGINLGLEIILDNNRSGALIAWQYFHPLTEVPDLIRHIDDYDRWQFKLKDTKAINKALWSYAPWTFEQWDHLAYPGISGLRIEGRALLRAHEANVATIVKSAVQFNIMTRDELLPGMIVNCSPMFSSDVGHELAVKSGTFGMVWVLMDKGVVKCSLRSNGDYDVSTIAKQFGGGGHKCAAGFEVDILTLLSWL